MANAIILGAGASSAEGAPLQKDLFKAYFQSFPGSSDAEHWMFRRLADFFKKMFFINVKKKLSESTEFPTFEEAMGLLDLAEQRREAMKGMPYEGIWSDYHRIRDYKYSLIFLMAKIIDKTLRTSLGHHTRLVRNLHTSGTLQRTVFVSTNYDILIDNALVSLRNQEVMLDYGLDFTNFEDIDDWHKPNPGAVKLFKVHGSLNWLYCPACSSLTLTPLEKGVMQLLINSKSHCKTCRTPILPIIVPPTYFKDMSNYFLTSVWHQLEQTLREVDHLAFCGYSFPDADLHFKYLLKRIQTNRRGKLRVSVFNHFPNKKAETSMEEKSRFQRFFGYKVRYEAVSFEDFSNDPDHFLT